MIIRIVSSSWFLACALALCGVPAFSQPLSASLAPSTTASTGGRLNATVTNGVCSVTPPAGPLAEGQGRLACLNQLLRRTPTPAISTPGSFFVGYVWGKNSNQLVYGPQVGVSAAIVFPLRRPFLERVDSGEATMQFRLPRNMSFTADLAVSLTTNLAAFTFPNQTSGASSNTQATFNASLYIAPELGWAWWDDDGKGHRVMFSVGVLAGYVNTEATGPGFALGVQPAIIASF